MPADEDQLSITPEARARLARFVSERRSALGLSREQVRAANGPGVVTQRKIENNQDEDLRSGTISKLDTGLALRPGTVWDLLYNGASPDPHASYEPEPSPRANIAEQLTNEELVAELLRRLQPRESTPAANVQRVQDGSAMPSDSTVQQPNGTQQDYARAAMKDRPGDPPRLEDEIAHREAQLEQDPP